MRRAASEKQPVHWPARQRVPWLPRNSSVLQNRIYAGPVRCDRKGFEAIERSFFSARNFAASHAFTAFIDIDGANAEAAAWISAFRWDDAAGILAELEWTRRGRLALQNRAFIFLAPIFSVDPETGRPRGLIPGHAAGSLTNTAPAGARLKPLAMEGVAAT